LRKWFKIPEGYPGFFSPWGKHSPGWKMLPSFLKKKSNLIGTLVVLLIILFIRAEIGWFYRVPSGSMKNTLQVGDVFLVNKLYFGFRTPGWIGIPATGFGFWIPVCRLFALHDPQPGDVIIFRYPRNLQEIFVKRVVATGGQTVEIVRKRVYVDGIEQPIPPDGQFHFARSIPLRFPDPTIFPKGAGNRDYYGPETVPEGHLFVLGDNRNNSSDSRFWGFLKEELVLGKAGMIIFSSDASKPVGNFREFLRLERFGRWIY